MQIVIVVFAEAHLTFLPRLAMKMSHLSLNFQKSCFYTALNILMEHYTWTDNLMCIEGGYLGYDSVYKGLCKSCFLKESLTLRW